MFPETIETDRLRLEPRWPENVDLDDCYRICASDPGIDEVTEYVTWDPTRPKRRRWSSSNAAANGGRITRRRATSSAPVRARTAPARSPASAASVSTGRNGPQSSARTWLRKRFWGRGYSGERAAALVEVAFENLDLDLVAVSHLPENAQSQRAIEKYVDRLGGRREGLLRNHITDPTAAASDEVRYSISQAEWREATQ